MRRSLTVNLLIVLLLGALTTCSGAPQEAPETTASSDAEATSTKEPPTFSNGFESGDRSEWSAASSDPIEEGEGAGEAESDD